MATQGWIRGEAVPGTPIPSCMEILGLSHALEIVCDYLTMSGVQVPNEIIVYAMDRRMLEIMLDWFNIGRLSVYTHGASEVVNLFYKLDRILPCILRFRVLPEDTFHDCDPAGLSMGSVMMGTAYRLYQRILPIVRVTAPGRLVRLALTKKEVKKRVMTRFYSDEKKAVQMLADQGSEACRILTKLHLDRTSIRLAHTELCGNRAAQVTLNSIVCATRFKFLDRAAAGVLLPALCQVCMRNQIDTFEHMMECTGLREIPEEQEFVVDYLVAMAKRALTPNPGIQIKFLADPELCLVDYSDSSLEEISF